jgi:carbon monoxide dehydrogenase subunit G
MDDREGGFDLELGYAFAVRAGFDEVFALLADVPASAAHFPGLEQLVPIGRNAYRWEMVPVGPPQWRLQVVYGARYSSQRSKGLVAWVPVEGVGNARVSGRWLVARRRGCTALELHLHGRLDTPVAALAQRLLEPVVRAAFEALVEQYIDRLIERFGGEVDEPPAATPRGAA